jgi:hypothetical protein
MSASLDDYLSDRFGPVFDALNDAGGVPEELMECLKRGAVWELGLKMTGDREEDVKLWYMGLMFAGHRNGKVNVSLQGPEYRHGSDDIPCLWLDDATPDGIFPHLSHLIEQESLT